MTAIDRDRVQTWLRARTAAIKPVSMRQLLSALVLIAALPLLVLDLVLYGHLATTERQAVRARLMDNVHVLSALVDNEIDTYVAVAATLATSPTLESADLNAFALQAQKAAALLPGSRLSLRDSAGHLLYPGTTAGGPDTAAPEGYQDVAARAFRSGRPQLSNVLPDRGGPAGTAFVVVPVFKSEAPIYALVLAVDMERFRSLILSDFGPDEVVAVLDGARNFVAERPDLHHFGDTAAVASWLAHVARAREGLAETTQGEGGSSVTAYAPTRDGWTVGISVPARVIDAPVQRIMWVTSLSGVALAIVSLGLGRALAARLSQSMVQLVAQARMVGHGETFAARSFMTREATAISAALGEASRELANGQAALRESESRFRGTFENAAVGIAHVALDGTWVEINQRLCDMLGYTRDELRVRTFQDITHPDDLAEDLAGVRSLLAGEREAYALDKRYIRKDGSVVWTGLTVALQRDAAGAPRYFISIVRDISRRREAEDHQQFLLHELAHRSKNQLAIIVAMARITARSALSLEAFSELFSRRIQGLAISTDLLVAQNWAGIALLDLVRRQLQAFVPAAERLRCQGPGVVLGADAAEAIGLALHELATNAVKHGAWSGPAGVVTVDWIAGQDAAGGLRLCWSERGGVQVEPPIRQGFGHDVIQRMVSQKLGAVVDLAFAPEGLTWTLSIAAKYLRGTDRADAS